MSTFAVVPFPTPFPLIFIPCLIKTLLDLGISYRQVESKLAQDAAIKGLDVVIEGENGKEIRFEKTEKGSYQVKVDTSGLNKEQLKRQQSLIKKIRQKCSYNMVLDQLKKQGYIIAEEKKVASNTIKLVARKWS